MKETVGSIRRGTLWDKWKIFVRKNGPSYLVGLSVYFVGMAILWSFFDSFDRAIFLLLLAVCMLGYAVAIPLLAKHKNSESIDQNSIPQSPSF